MTTARTGLVCLLGDPVEHSLSPQLHTAAFAASGIDAVYVACAVRDVGAAIDGLDALGALGANVTVPHKRTVWQLVTHRTPEAELIGAANTLFRAAPSDDGGRGIAPHGVDADGGRDAGPDGVHGAVADGGRGAGADTSHWACDNTDAVGLQRVLVDDIGVDAGDPVVVFGAGGAARAAAVALGRLGAAVRVEARRPVAAAEVASLAQRAGARRLGSDARPTVVVNATPLGLRGERLPDRFHELDRDQVALDLVYGVPTTPFVADARVRGCHAVDGIGMLVGQAAAAFTRWTGQPAPTAMMTAAARSAMPADATTT